MERDIKIKELEDKIKELQTICLDYAEGSYGFLSTFSEESIAKLTAFEQLAFKKLKEQIDNHITSDTYKNYLEHKYIDKDLTNDMLLDFVTVDFNNTFTQNLLNEQFEEDDTDTLVIVEE